MKNTITFTIPKNYDFSHKLNALKTEGSYCWYDTKKILNEDITKNIKFAIIIHNGVEYLTDVDCIEIFYDEHHTPYLTRINMVNLIERQRTMQKGFQGVRYSETGGE